MPHILCFIISMVVCVCIVYRIAGIFRGYKCSRFSRIEPVPRKFINSRRVANGVEVQLHVDVRMRQKGELRPRK